MNNNKKTIKLFLALYILGYIIFNWSNVSWVFNYKAVSGLTYAFFYPYANQSLPTPTIPNIFSNQEISIKPEVLIKPDISEKQNVLEIPAIALETEIVFPESNNVNVLHDYLDKGVIFYPGSAELGTNGQSIFLGHSAPPNWPKIKHDWVFTNLEKLKIGDEIIINLDYVKYTYKVKNKTIIAKGQEIEKELTYLNNVLVLVSCYPPGKDFQRIVISAEIINNYK